MVSAACCKLRNVSKGIEYDPFSKAIEVKYKARDFPESWLLTSEAMVRIGDSITWLPLNASRKRTWKYSPPLTVVPVVSFPSHVTVSGGAPDPERVRTTSWVSAFCTTTSQETIRFLGEAVRVKTAVPCSGSPGLMILGVTSSPASGSSRVTRMAAVSADRLPAESLSTNRASNTPEGRILGPTLQTISWGGAFWPE